VVNAWLISLDMLMENGVAFMKFRKLDDAMLDKKRMQEVV
jgi:hypothetical protein